MRTSILTAGIAGVLAIGGTTAAFAATNGNDDTPTSAQPTAVQRATTGAIISHARANQLAHQAVPGARITSGELEHRDTVWDIDLVKGQVRYEVDIDAHSGRVLEVDRDFDGDRRATRDVRRLDSPRDVRERADVRHLDSPRDVQERGGIRHTAPRHTAVPEDNPARHLDDNHRDRHGDDNHRDRHGDDNHRDRHGDDNHGGDDHGGDDGGNSGRH